MLCRYNVVSETDLANALERVSAYVNQRATEAPKITPISRRTRTEPGQSDDDRGQRRCGSGANPASEKMAAGWIEQPT
jgi:hypothetical protein